MDNLQSESVRIDVRKIIIEDIKEHIKQGGVSHLADLFETIDFLIMEKAASLDFNHKTLLRQSILIGLQYKVAVSLSNH